MAINACPLCLEKQREIDDLKEENRRLRTVLRHERRKREEGAFGSSTPSSKIPIKPNARDEEKKPKGARLGHPGNGRKDLNKEPVDDIIEVEAQVEICPQCGIPLENKGMEERSVIDTPSHKPQRILFLLPKRHCCRCGQTFRPQPPGYFPKACMGTNSSPMQSPCITSMVFPWDVLANPPA